jgi:hypothetical protein
MVKNERTADAKDSVYVAVGVAALGGLLFGYDTGVIRVLAAGSDATHLQHSGVSY